MVPTLFGLLALRAGPDVHPGEPVTCIPSVHGGVLGEQLLGQLVRFAERLVPGKRVQSLQTLLLRPGRPTTVDVEHLQSGRTGTSPDAKVVLAWHEVAEAAQVGADAAGAQCIVIDPATPRHPDLVSRDLDGLRAGRPVLDQRADPAGLAGVREVLHRRNPDLAAKGCFTATWVCRYNNDFQAPFPDDVTPTSIYSKRDGVVRWQACVVPYARCVEVRGSHIGLAFNRYAYREIAWTLAG